MQTLKEKYEPLLSGTQQKCKENSSKANDYSKQNKTHRNSKWRRIKNKKRKNTACEEIRPIRSEVKEALPTLLPALSLCKRSIK